MRHTKHLLSIDIDFELIHRRRFDWNFSFFLQNVATIANAKESDEGEATDSSLSSFESQESGDSPSRKRKAFDEDAVIATALNYLSTSEPAKDELWQFMSYLHTVLKKLPPHLQLELKQKIQKAMCEVDNKQENGENGHIFKDSDKEVVPDQ